MLKITTAIRSLNGTEILLGLKCVTRPLYVSVFIDGSKKSIYLQICVYSMCVCVCMHALICARMQELVGPFLQSVCLCACVYACVCVHTPCANVVKAGGNPIGYDLCWQVLRAIVITPV